MSFGRGEAFADDVGFSLKCNSEDGYRWNPHLCIFPLLRGLYSFRQIDFFYPLKTKLRLFQAVE